MKRLNDILKRSFLAGLTSILFLTCGGDDKTVVGPRNQTPPSSTNRAPIILSQPLTQIYESSFYEYPIQVMDADGDEINYSLPEKPSWLSVSGNVISGNS